MTQVTLTIDDGQLAVPHTAFTANWVRDMEEFPELHGKWSWDDEAGKSVSSIKDEAGEYHPHRLGGRDYSKGGEPFSCDWRDGNPDMAHLAIALFDARETGAMVDVSEVTLPDGRTFVIDADYGQDDYYRNTWY